MSVRVFSAFSGSLRRWKASNARNFHQMIPPWKIALETPKDCRPRCGLSKSLPQITAEIDGLTPVGKIRPLHTCARYSNPVQNPPPSPIPSFYSTTPTPTNTDTTTHPAPNNQRHRRSSPNRVKKRLQLRQTEEIEELLDEHADLIVEFAGVLSCSEAAMRDMVRRDTRILTTFHKEAVKSKMRLLLEYGFSSSEILMKYQVFARSLPHLLRRLKTVEEVRRYRRPIILLLLNDAQFNAKMAFYRQEIAVMGDHSSQTSFLADLLDCSLEEIEIISRKPNHEFLISLPPSRLRAIVEVIRSEGLSLDEIRDKSLMLRCRPNLARERLRRVREAGVFERGLVSYILTNSEAHFEASFDTWVANAEALGCHDDERALLMHRLGCSERELDEVISKNQHIAGMSSAKIQSCLDVLLKEVQLSPLTVLQQGKLLYYSPHRLRARWALLRTFNLSESARVHELLLSERKFLAKYGYGSE